MIRMRTLLGCACLSLSVFAAACGGANAKEEPTVTQLNVLLTDNGCRPAGLQAPAGRLTFIVSNTESQLVTEFQVYDREKILGEADDINPGDMKSFTRDIEPGTYRVVCGTAGHEGVLTVAG